MILTSHALTEHEPLRPVNAPREFVGHARPARDPVAAALLRRVEP